MAKKTKIIRVSDEILGGTPVFAGTRVPAKALMDYLERGHTLKEFLADFPTVKRAQAIGLIEMASSMVLRHARAA